MDASRWKDLERIVNSSLRQPAGHRAAFLEASAEDAGYAATELLEVCAGLLAVDSEKTPDWGTALLPEESEPVLAGIEAFELLEELGSGGMGVVYRARQRGAVEREVALKLCPTQPSAHLRQRLRQERRTLARLNHPNIAQMLEAGDTATGQPYFVMELVTGGLPINQYCDAHRLSVAQRLQLLIAVCAGVQYAHQQGVLHRDLKPANVLATGPAEHPQIKIIDFGIAKLLQADVAEHPIEGSAGAAGSDLTGLAILGTPNYMSPERLRLSATDVDSRSDIYSLGVMLHELLLGEPPCSRRVGEPIAEYRQRRADQAAPTLETAWESMDADHQQQLAQALSLSRAKMHQVLRSDLRWIVAKATADDPAERYAAASELAADLRRYLGLQPVLAAPPTLRHQLGLFIRRRRLPVIIGTLAISALLVALWLRGVEAERANAAAQKALQSQRETEQAMDFLSDLFIAADPRENLGQPADAGELLRRGVAQLAEGELDDAPLVRARLLHTIAGVQWRRGDPQAAVELAAKALALREREAPDDLALRAESLHLTGTLYSEVDQYPLAEKMLAEALELRQSIFGPGSAQALSTLNNIGAIREETSDYAGALEAYQQTLDLLAVHGPERELDYARTLSNKGVALRRVNRYEDARAAHQQSLAIHQRRLDPAHPSIALDYNNLGDLALAERDYEGALAAFEEAERRYRLVLGNEHADLARVLNGKGNAYVSMGQWALADASYLQALAIYDRQDSWAAAYPLSNLALVALALHDWPLLAERTDAFLKRFPEGSWDPELWAQMRCLNARQRADSQALAWIDEGLEIIGTDGEANGDFRRSRCLLAGLTVADRMQDQGRAQTYLAALHELVESGQFRVLGFELRLREAMQAAAAGDQQRAAQLAQSLLNDWPEDQAADDGIVREARLLVAPAQKN